MGRKKVKNKEINIKHGIRRIIIVAVILIAIITITKIITIHLLTKKQVQVRKQQPKLMMLSIQCTYQIILILLAKIL